MPVNLESGMQGLVSLVGRTDWLSDQQRLELHMLALYAHGRLRVLNTVAQDRRRRAISPREAEVLKWVASGKTAGLSAHTVNQPCENAQRRLGTNNRLHTVVEAIRHSSSRSDACFVPPALGELTISGAETSCLFS